MAETKYIVLRTKKVVPSDFVGIDIASAGAGPDEMTLEQAELSSAEKADLKRDPRTKAIAQPMPLKLIEPLDEAAAQPAATNTWGVDAVGAPGSPFDGSGIKVAVLDTGIDPNHEAFAGVTLERKNFTTAGDDDTNGHGTHCAGTIFGRDVGGQRIGVAQGVTDAMIGKVLGQGGGSTATLSDAINWALSGGAHVISMSLGIDFPGFVKILENQGMQTEPATSIALEQYRANVNLFSAIAELVRTHSAFGQGTLVVAASGNESNRPTFTIAVAPPAAGQGIIAVGALGESGSGQQVASFSNTECDLSGPGVAVTSAKVGGGLRTISGTSMATPHVAGCAALWAQKLQVGGRINPEVLRAQVIARASTSSLNAGFEESDVGTGMVQAPSS